MQDEKKNLAIYALVIIGILTQLIPVIDFQVFSFLLVLGLFLVLPLYGRSLDHSSSHYSHVIWINRSLWIWSFILTICLILCGIFVALTFDRIEFLNSMSDLASMNTDAPLVKKLFWISTASATPSFFYLGWRVFKGLRMALSGLPINNPKSLI